MGSSRLQLLSPVQLKNWQFHFVLFKPLKQCYQVSPIGAICFVENNQGRVLMSRSGYPHSSKGT